MKRILCVWLPNWPIQRMVVHNPQLAYQPVVLFRQDARRGQLVAACSRSASAGGIRQEMPLSEAKSLALKITEKQTEQNPRTLTIEKHNPESDYSKLFELAEECEKFSPIVGLEDVSQPSSIFMEVTGLSALFGGEFQLAQQVGAYFHQLGYLPRIAIADTVGASWAIAHFASYLVQDREETNRLLSLKFKWSKLQRKQDHSLSKDTPQQVIDAAMSVPIDSSDASNDPRDDSQDIPTETHSKRPALPRPIVAENSWPTSHPKILESLPVEALRVPHATCEVLHQLGIHKIHQLLKLPRVSLASRLGEDLIDRLDQATGKSDEVLVAIHPPPQLVATLSLEYPTRHRSTLEEILKRLVSDLCKELHVQQLGAIRVSCFFKDDKKQKKQIRIGLFRPSAVSGHLMELIQMQLERLQFREEVIEVGAEINLAAPLISKQRVLFDQGPKTDRSELAQLVNRLSSRLGEDAVLRPQPMPNAQPEHSFRMRVLTGQSQKKQKPAKKKKSKKPIESTEPADPGAIPNEPLHRPLVLLNPPVELTEIELSDGRSNFSAFNYKKSKLQVTELWGPERIETGWWRGRIARRDYFRIETHLGTRYWIYRELKSGKWFLHGEFS